MSEDCRDYLRYKDIEISDVWESDEYWQCSDNQETCWIDDPQTARTVSDYFSLSSLDTDIVTVQVVNGNPGSPAARQYFLAADEQGETEIVVIWHGKQSLRIPISVADGK